MLQRRRVAAEQLPAAVRWLRCRQLSGSQRPLLAFEEVGAVGDQKCCTAVLVHGLLGTGRNWRTPAKKLAQRAAELAPEGAPPWRIVLADLRNHGKSAEISGFGPPHDMAAAARDVADLVAESGWGHMPVIIGHSLGGKVALEYARLLSQEGGAVRGVQPPDQVWVLDSVPSRFGADEDPPGDVEKVVATLRSLPSTVPSRRWLLQELQERGYSRPLAEWLGTNLRRADGGQGEQVTWVFNREGAAEMFDAYKRADYLDFLRMPPPGMRIDFVRADRSDRWLPRILADLEAAVKQSPKESAASGAVGLHLLPNATHWLHMDNPDGLVEMVAPSLARIAAAAKA